MYYFGLLNDHEQFWKDTGKWLKYSCVVDLKTYSERLLLLIQSNMRLDRLSAAL